MKKFRKFLLYTLLAITVVVVALIISVFLFKERIIHQFVQRANTQLNTPVKIGKIDVSIFQHFPNLSIVFNDVYVEDSHPGNYPLFTASRVSFIMDPFEVYSGIYNIRGVFVEDSETSLKVNDAGKNNYNILKEAPSGTSTQPLKLELKDVVLKKTKVNFFHLPARQQMVFISHHLKASIRTENSIYDIDASGHLASDMINISGKSYMTGKSFDVESNIRYDDALRKIYISPSELKLNRSSFTVAGTYGWKTKNIIDLKMEGRDADIQTILSFLPESLRQDFEKYRSKGDVYFNAALNGEISKLINPALKIDFGFSDATIYQPEYKTSIQQANLKGSFSANDVSNLSGAKLSLTNITGRLNEEPFRGNLLIRDLTDPYVKADFNGKLDAKSIMAFYPVEQLQNVSGSLMVDIALDGKVGLLKKRATAGQVSTQGTIDLQKISFKYGQEKVPVRDLTGSLQFSNNDLALSNVSGSFGNSDFLLNGFFKNVITFLLFENQPIGVEADLKSNFMDVDELFHLAYASEETGTTKASYDFGISGNVYLNFNCDVGRLNYKRFRGRKIKGDLLVKNKVAVSRNLRLETMGGNLILSGIVDSNNPKAIDVVCTSKLNNINLDSIFYVFENFDQKFILDKHLRGNVTADVNFEMTLNERLRLYPETLVADIGAVIRNGELNNFEPLKKLNKYLDDEGLNHLRFSDLKNDIHIENKTVYIPQMQINSNVTSLKISGTHTFDQRIDYHIVTPFRGKKSSQNEDFAKAVELDNNGQTKLFLKITGTTDDYRVQYDTEAVKKKIVSDLKREVKELKDAFRNKETQKKKELELQEDEYFDWPE